MSTVVRGIVRRCDRQVRVPYDQTGRLYAGMAAKSFSIVPADEDGTSTSVRPLLVTVEQAGAILSLSRSSMYQLMWSEELVPIRIGRSVRFSIEQLERFVTERQPGDKE